MPQRGGAHAQDGGELRDVHRVRGTRLADRLPGDTASRPDRPGAFRADIAVGQAELAHCAADTDPSFPADDTLIAHPRYGAAGWLAVTNPAERTAAATRELLRTAHRLARTRHGRRARPGE
ncbi:DUF6194 family protein [Kitasatospora sp. NPDC001540]|uniref:DUF6194 family protein n=1 Tax=Kitasatospora sp. NPDC001540 TaxID=3364014 RepID=UPI0036A605D2